VFLMHWLFGKTGKRNRVRPRAHMFVEMLEARDVPSSFSIVDLGTLGGANSYASAINASGVVVGQAQTAARTSDAIVWTNGAMTDLGAPSSGSGQATSINAGGQVVGAFTVQQGEAGSESGFLYDNGTTSDLGTSVYPRGINDLGQIVGGYATPVGVCTPLFLTTANGPTWAPSAAPSAPPTRSTTPARWSAVRSSRRRRPTSMRFSGRTAP
jgi:probable HAF family extracellular repeat protein